MKTRNIFLILSFVLLTHSTFATSFTWTGSTNTVFTATSNWNPSTGYPTSNDTVIIVSASNIPTLSANHDVYRLEVLSGTLRLNGYELTVQGNSSFSGGLIEDGSLVLRGTKCVFAGTNFNTSLDVNSDRIELSGGIFNESCLFVTTGQDYSPGNGGCEFNNNVTIIHNGAGGNAFRMAMINGDEFNGNTVITNSSNGRIIIADAGTTYFNGNLELNNNGSNSILFAYSGGTSAMASGKTISIGSTGYSANSLVLYNFTQNGTASQNLVLTGTAQLLVKNCMFNGNATLTAPELLCSFSTFNGTATITKSGIRANYWYGSNLFNQSTTIVNQGNGTSDELRLADINPNTYNSNATFISTGKPIQVVWNGGSTFKGNITKTGDGITFNKGITTLSGSNTQSLEGTAFYDFTDLTINKTANHVDANETLEVNGILDLQNGNLVTDATNLLTMNTGSSVINASNTSFISGPVKKVGNTAFEFPVGKEIFFRPLSISTSDLVTNAFYCEFFNSGQILGDSTDSTIDYLSDCMNWNLIQSNGSSTINITLTWDSSFCWTIDSTFMRIAHWNGNLWTDMGECNVLGRLSGTITNINPNNSFGFFTLANSAPSTICATIYELGNTGTVLLASSILANTQLQNQGLINLNTSTLTTFGFNSPITISILGDLVLDVPFNLHKANIFMDQGSTISYSSVNNIIFNVTTTHIQGCKERDMWKGITIDGNFINELNIVSNSVIEDAEIAVTSNNGGEYAIDNSTLNKNNIGIIINAFTGAHPGIFQNNSQIKCSQFYFNSVPGVLKSPFLGQRSELGIFAIDCTIFQVGNPNSNPNTFFNLDFGIRSIDCSSIIRNNDFSQCGTNGTGCAIYANYDYFPTTGINHLITVGGIGATDRNNFEDCQVAIFTSTMSCLIQNNYILRGDVGIQISNSQIINSVPTIIEIEILDNVLENLNSKFMNLTSISNTSTFDIINNVLSRDVLLANGTTGMWISNAANTTNNLDVNSNIFNNIRWGILLNSLMPPANTPIKPVNVVKNNIFNFSNTNVIGSFADFIGIQLNNSRGIWVGLNIFNRFNGNATLEENDMIGITMNNAIGCNIVTNQFNAFGTGIRMRTFNTGSRLRCNEFNNNHQSIRLGQANAFATLTNQGSLNLPWDNVWNNNIAAFRAEGTSNTFIWFFRNLPGSNNQFEPTNNLVFQTVGNINNPSVCPVIPPSIMVDREYELKPFIQDSIAYTDHAEIQHWLGYFYTYWTLKNDTTLIVQNLPEDSIYFNFVNDVSNTNIGYFYELEELIANNDYDDAVNLLASITDTNELEYNLKTFYEIYMNSYMIGELPDSQELNYLTEMANQNFLDGGPAVWLARHTLGVEIDEDYPANRLGVIANQQPNNNPTVEVISNPAKKFIYLLIEDQITPFKYELYNSVGQLVLNGELTANELTIDISKISNGFYVFKIINWNQMMTSKIVIQND